jgi:hypothetical protein
VTNALPIFCFIVLICLRTDFDSERGGNDLGEMQFEQAEDQLVTPCFFGLEIKVVLVDSGIAGIYSLIRGATTYHRSQRLRVVWFGIVYDCLHNFATFTILH